MYIRIHTNTRTYTYTYTNIHIYTHIHTHIHLHTPYFTKYIKISFTNPVKSINTSTNSTTIQSCAHCVYDGYHINCC